MIKKSAMVITYNYGIKDEPNLKKTGKKLLVCRTDVAEVFVFLAHGPL
jgi:hypothetical protein